MADGAYWFDAATGNFVSSTWYMEELPSWVEKFNNRKLAQGYAKETWNLALDKSMYTASGPDDSPYEAVLGGKKKAVFPYVLSEMIKKDDGFGLVSTTPFGNQLITEMAFAALDGENLGKGLVAVSSLSTLNEPSATDTTTMRTLVGAFRGAATSCNVAKRYWLSGSQPLNTMWLFSSFA